MSAKVARVEVENAVAANLAARVTDVATERGLALVSAFTLYGNAAAEDFYAKTLPGVGIWVQQPARTGSKRTEVRDWRVIVVADCLFKTATRADVDEHSDAYAEAILRVLEGLGGTGTILGANLGETDAAVDTDLGEMIVGAASLENPRGQFLGGCRVRSLVLQRESFGV